MVFQPVEGFTLIPVAFRFDQEAKNLFYRGDTADSEAVIKLAKGCDVLIHDVITTEANLRIWPTLKSAHAFHGEAGKAARLTGDKKLVLFYWPAELETMESDLIAMAKKRIRWRSYPRQGFTHNGTLNQKAVSQANGPRF